MFVSAAHVLLFSFLSMCHGLDMVTEKSDFFANCTNSTLNNSTDPMCSKPPLVLFGVLNTLDDFIKWAGKEEEIVKVLTKRLELIDLEINLLDNYLKDYQESTVAAIQNSKESIMNTPEERGRYVGSSPVLGHRMTSRYAGVLADIRKLLSSPDYQDNELDIERILLELNRNESAKWVGNEDWFMSAQGFLHIQDVNGHKPYDVYHGFNLENISNVTLLPGQIVDIGMFALYRKKYVLSVNWFEYAMQMAGDFEAEKMEEENIPRDLVGLLYRLAAQEHNRALANPDSKNSYEINLSLYTNPIPNAGISNRNVILETMSGLGRNNTHSAGQFMNLCRGNSAVPPEIEKKLRCYYEKSQHPYLYINPVKVEVLSESPEIYQFYDIINGVTFGEELRRNYSNKLAASLTFGTSLQIENLTKARTSVGIGMEYESTPLKSFSLASMLTGIVIYDRPDRIQYAEYTYGRYYDFHPDYIGNGPGTRMMKEYEILGDRVATLLYYLEVPEEGGYTAFCEAGVVGRPVKGSAIFWFNMYRNGKPRLDVTHGSCPVIHGHKTIMNYWIRYNSNWQHYKCSRSPYK